MRLRKGDKVEVMNKKDAPVSWRVAEILSGNGHTYRVQYDSYPDMASEQMVETVPRKFVRPCPPLVQGVENYITGDTVEVFHESAWKVAAILKVLEGNKETKSKKIPVRAAKVQNQYLVRLLGCSQELIVDKWNIRMRQSWHDDKWIVIGKSCGGGEDVIASKPSTSNYYQKMNFRIPQFRERAKKRMNIQDESAFWESHMVASKSLKRRSPYYSSIVEADNRQKLRAIAKDGRKQRVVAAPLLEKATVGGMHHLLPKLKDDARVCCLSLGINFWTIQSSTFQLMQLFMANSWYHNLL